MDKLQGGFLHWALLRASTSCSAQQATKVLNKQIFPSPVPAASLPIWRVHNMKLICGPSTGPGNGRRFIDGDVSLGDILPNLLSETYALVKKGNYRKYIDGILYISFVKITPNVCLKSWKLRKIAKKITKSK